MLLNLKHRAKIHGNNYLLSTVALPYFNFDDEYETMVFPISDDGVIDFGELYVCRYSNSEDAVKHHKALVRKMRKGIKFWEDEDV